MSKKYKIQWYEYEYLVNTLIEDMIYDDYDWRHNDIKVTDYSMDIVAECGIHLEIDLAIYQHKITYLQKVFAKIWELLMIYVQFMQKWDTKINLLRIIWIICMKILQRESIHFILLIPYGVIDEEEEIKYDHW